MSFRYEIEVPVSDFMVEWKRCDMLANHLGEYVAYLFPKREKVENLVSTVTNELFEALVCVAKPDSVLGVRVHGDQHKLVFKVDHTLAVREALAYGSFMQELVADCDQSIYLSMLTKASALEMQFNQFGLAMIRHDFNAELGLQLDDNMANGATFMTLSMGELDR